MATLDALCVLIAAFAAQGARFFESAAILQIEDHQISYTLVSTIISVAWWLALWLSSSRSSNILGVGSEEYRRVTRASIWLFACLCLVSFTGALSVARGYVLIALPVGLVLLLIERWTLRHQLIRKRRGDAQVRVMVIGDELSTSHLIRKLNAAPQSGLAPIAAYLPEEPVAEWIPELTSIPWRADGMDIESIREVVQELSVDMVAVSTGHQFPPEDLRRLGWVLSEDDVGLVIAPPMTDIAAPRFHTQPINGVPLIHVAAPNMHGSAGAMKRLTDIVLSGLALIVLSPVMALIAISIKLDKPAGPVLFVQERIGHNGSTFNMFKFRSMMPDSHELKDALMEHLDGNSVLFKMANDPRVTRVGKTLRRYSLDELPQLFNVFRGDMSLVGPRPPLREEVDQYEAPVHRRLLVKPGITGLWQVSGRSDLSWADSTRLDLYYVENWSVGFDLNILARTVQAVVSKNGAY
ncbi:sugar transferase [Kocuria massiliensis]|uniref:sugar transferase n=1 Tax=Kocuria massiliensis TaxID=1926282 RepID=UPI0022B97A88|nr:sugar transferase [Kocuria massiliensis]